MNELIIKTLSSLTVPVSFQDYKGNETTYITFFTVDERAALRADDEEQATSHSIQVDVWSKTDYTNLIKEVKTLMKNGGFVRTSEADLYESDTGIYHKAIRFYYAK